MAVKFHRLVTAQAVSKRKRFSTLAFFCWTFLAYPCVTAVGKEEPSMLRNHSGSTSETTSGQTSQCEDGLASEEEAAQGKECQATAAVASRLYDCPKNQVLKKARNDVGDYFDYYTPYIKQHLQRGLVNFRDDRTYGGRDVSYNQMKRASSKCKAKAFGDNLRSGDKLYESGCGEGFNLLMTLEILKEERNIDDLAAFGNDYLYENVAVASMLFDAAEKSARVRKGKICRGDSTDLSFVPSSTFDLAYTGFLNPLEEPLQTIRAGSSRGEEEPRTLDEALERSKALCRSNDRADRERARREQGAQEDWHAEWTQELVRIVKPGKVVIVEDVGFPICNETSEWGGVSPEWWVKAITKYEWDIDPTSVSIEFGPWYFNRYNVMMRRNG